jgi:enhancing lycopene biosynthesis protein 2
MARIGVCLSGCGVNDGAEIHESVITALTLDRAGAEIIYTAPDVVQTKVVNHITGDEMNETRNVLVESARIARGDITDLAQLTSDDMDALLFPGGFGAALNLCDFALKGADCHIHPEVKRIIQEMLAAQKPLGFICIAPALFARAVKNVDMTAKITIGNDQATADQIEKLGSQHEICSVDDCIVDEENKIVSTPAYMLAGNISEAATGIEKLVHQIMKWV